MPLGDAYLELVTAVDAAEAARSSFGRWVTASQSELLRPLGWAVRTEGLDEVASRLGLTIEAGSRTGRDGQLVRWRLAGVEEAAAEPALPFFIEWAPGTRLPGRARTAHATGEVSIAEVCVRGDPHHIKSWLGTHHVPIDIRPGTSAITAVILRSASRDIPAHSRRPPSILCRRHGSHGNGWKIAATVAGVASLLRRNRCRWR